MADPIQEYKMIFYAAIKSGNISRCFGKIWKKRIIRIKAKVKFVRSISYKTIQSQNMDLSSFPKE